MRTIHSKYCENCIYSILKFRTLKYYCVKKKEFVKDKGTCDLFIPDMLERMKVI